MTRASLLSITSENKQPTINSGQMTKRISSWTHPQFKTPPPKNLKKKVQHEYYCSAKKRITCWQNPFEVDRYPLFQ
jgi:hypothetical protein